MAEVMSVEAGRALARWLAPFLREELGLEQPSEREGYDEQTCALFISTVGDVVLANAATFFERLAREGEIGSLALADAIGVAGPRSIPAVLTTPLKRRAKTLALPYPWREDAHGERTAWLDLDGTSARMLDAIRAEKTRRSARRGA